MALQYLPQYIPLQAGQSAFFAKQKLISDLLGVVGYEVRDGYVIFTEDITATKDVDFVDMQLIVMDFEKYSDYDQLPLPADMAAAVVEEVYQMLLQTPPPNKKVDSIDKS
jgi:hypothetical protein